MKYKLPKYTNRIRYYTNGVVDPRWLKRMKRKGVIL